jgi:hypothetical protein
MNKVDQNGAQILFAQQTDSSGKSPITELIFNKLSKIELTTQKPKSTTPYVDESKMKMI